MTVNIVLVFSAVSNAADRSTLTSLRRLRTGRCTRSQSRPRHQWANGHAFMLLGLPGDGSHRTLSPRSPPHYPPSDPGPGSRVVLTDLEIASHTTSLRHAYRCRMRRSVSPKQCRSWRVARRPVLPTRWPSRLRRHCWQRSPVLIPRLLRSSPGAIRCRT
jgi:hypothetical protein